MTRTLRIDSIALNQSSRRIGVSGTLRFGTHPGPFSYMSISATLEHDKSEEVVSLIEKHLAPMLDAEPWGPLAEDVE